MSQHPNKPERPVLLVATPGPEGVDPLGGELGHRRGAGQLELPLLPEHFIVYGMIIPLSRMIHARFRKQSFLWPCERTVTEFQLPDGAFLASCGPPLMPVITRDTHFNDLMGSSETETNG